MPFRLVHILLLLVAFAGKGEVWGQEEGLASYYHNRFHGRKAASGRVHDADELVAAHRTYPFGTFLRVTNLANMKRVIVCVTDRGPFRKGRIIDVSVGAAELLGFKKKGLAVSVSRSFRVKSISAFSIFSIPRFLFWKWIIFG